MADRYTKILVTATLLCLIWLCLAGCGSDATDPQSHPEPLALTLECRCPKCGGFDLGIRHQEAYVSSLTGKYVPEHLTIRCNDCGYSWERPPLDRRGPEAGGVTLRSEPLLPPAASPQDAVREFWAAMVEENYEAATMHYPGLVDRYGSRKQAALRLRDAFSSNPPIQVSSVGEPEAVPESGDLRVSYRVSLRDGQARTGEFIVRRAASAEPAYFIVTGP